MQRITSLIVKIQSYERVAMINFATLQLCNFKKK